MQLTRLWYEYAMQHRREGEERVKFYSRAEMGSNVSGKQGFTQTRKTASSSYNALEDHRAHRRLSYHHIIVALQDTIQLDRRRLLVMVDGDKHATPQSRFDSRSKIGIIIWHALRFSHPASREGSLTSLIIPLARCVEKNFKFNNWVQLLAYALLFGRLSSQH